MNIKFFVVMFLMTSLIILSGCVNTPEIQQIPKVSIPVSVLVEDRTGDLSDGLLKLESGWYDRIERTKIRYIKDSTKNMPSENRITFLLITNDTNPDIKISSYDGYYLVNTDVVINPYGSRVPMGYPEGGKRVYEITIGYNRQNIIPPNILIIRNNYYDTPDRVYIEFQKFI